jgi:methyl-accepting chemotaxis protein
MTSTRNSARPAWTQSMRLPIRVRFCALVSLLLLACTLTLTLATFLAARKVLYDQIDLRLSVIARDRQKLLQSYVQQQQERIALVASRTRLRQLLTQYHEGSLPEDEMRTETQEILADALASTEGFLSISIAFPEGKVVTSTDPAMRNTDLSNQSEFLAGRSEFYFARPDSDRLNPMTKVAAPFELADSAENGVILVSLDIKPMVGFMTDSQGLGDTGELLVGIPRSDGSAEFDYLMPLRHRADPRLPLIADDGVMFKAISGQSGFVTTHDYRGQEVLAAHTPVEYRNWGMVAKIDMVEAYAPVDQLARLTFAIGVLTLLLGYLVAFWLARRFTAPIIRLTQSVDELASGDQSAESPPLSSTNDEVGDLASAFQSMKVRLSEQHLDLLKQAEIERNQRQQVESLTTELTVSLESEREARKRVEQLLAGIRDAVATLGRDTSHLHALARSQVAAVGEQAVSLSETCATVAEVTQSARQAADHATRVEHSSREAVNVGRSGRDAVMNARDVMQDVRRHFEETVTKVVSFAEHAQTIGGIIAVVNEIAEQTNVLALNAAVEASRAGEFGRGFAVVASEVKRLALQSQESAQQINKILSETIAATSTAVDSARLGHDAVSGADVVIAQAVSTIDELAQAIDQAAQAATQILASTGQQAAAMNQIQQTMAGIEEASQRTTDAANQCESTSTDLQRLGLQLRELIEAGARDDSETGA